MGISCRNPAFLRSDIGKTGFTALDNSIDEVLLESLCREAALQRKNALRATDDGIISYKGYLADLDNVSRTFLTGDSLAGFLHSVFGQPLVLSENSSCYTYYEAGDFISAHRDEKSDCEATMLVYLDVSSPDPDAPDSGLLLNIYDDHAGKPAGLRHSIRTRRGLVVAGRGSRVWHGRPPLLEGEQVTLLSACFSSTG